MLLWFLEHRFCLQLDDTYQKDVARDEEKEKDQVEEEENAIEMEDDFSGMARDPEKRSEYSLRFAVSRYNKAYSIFCCPDNEEDKEEENEQDEQDDEMDRKIGDLENDENRGLDRDMWGSDDEMNDEPLKKEEEGRGSGQQSESRIEAKEENKSQNDQQKHPEDGQQDETQLEHQDEDQTEELQEETMPSATPEDDALNRLLLEDLADSQNEKLEEDALDLECLERSDDENGEDEPVEEDKILEKVQTDENFEDGQDQTKPDSEMIDDADPEEEHGEGGLDPGEAAEQQMEDEVEQHGDSGGMNGANAEEAKAQSQFNREPEEADSGDHCDRKSISVGSALNENACVMSAATTTTVQPEEVDSGRSSDRRQLASEQAEKRPMMGSTVQPDGHKSRSKKPTNSEVESALFQHIGVDEMETDAAEIFDAATEQQAREAAAPFMGHECSEDRPLKRPRLERMDFDSEEHLQHSGKDVGEATNSEVCKTQEGNSEDEVNFSGGGALPVPNKQDQNFQSQFFTSENAVSSTVTGLAAPTAPDSVFDQGSWSIASIDPELVSEANRHWTQCEAAMSGLTRQLCEQLRLILEPTVVAKYQGDFRSGRRLNMRKVIPYVASGYRKDNIWLRRARPSRRDYQLLVAVDDTMSMRENHCDQLTLQVNMLHCYSKVVSPPDHQIMLNSSHCTSRFSPCRNVSYLACGIAGTIV